MEIQVSDDFTELTERFRLLSEEYNESYGKEVLKLKSFLVGKKVIRKGLEWYIADLYITNRLTVRCYLSKAPNTRYELTCETEELEIVKEKE